MSPNLRPGPVWVQVVSRWYESEVDTRGTVPTFRRVSVPVLGTPPTRDSRGVENGRHRDR